ncbi:MAG: YggT family protein [Oscillospiraceae bacterium]|nr:YggT family protein [Oscillospiraceae bacterium]
MLIGILQRFILTVLRIYELLFIVRAILSWIPPAQGSGFSYFLHSVTEPILAPIRKVLFKIPFFASLPIDLSVLVAFFLIDIVRTVVFYII